MKNVFKVICTLIAIALVYVLYLIALGDRYYFDNRIIYDKWKQKAMLFVSNSAYEWQDWDEDTRD